MDPAALSAALAEVRTASSEPEEEEEEEAARQEEDPGARRSSTWLTARVQAQLAELRTWDWVRIIWWCYVWPPVLILYKIIPTFLNIALARLTIAMQGLLEVHESELVGFVLIMFFTYCTGMFLFMLPPVPGPPIYLFAGIVIPKAGELALHVGPETRGVYPQGFWLGAVLTVSLCFFMKLSACTVQQKMIGERLGDREWVRQLVRVHTAEMRTIESVLRKPGLAFGKVMILCGGPDWPTSVLAGILRVPLRQCIIGTCPVIASVIPLALSGTFLVKRGDGPVWARAGTLMFSLTVVVSLVFIGGTAWSIQDEYERHHDRFTQPKEEYVHLEWLDHRTSKVRERCVVTWADLPLFIRIPYVTGAALLIVVGEIFLVAKQACVSNFVLGTDLENTLQLKELKWIGRSALITPLGAGSLLAALFALAGLTVYKSWYRSICAPRIVAAIAELDAQEASWKAARVLEARAARKSPEQLRLERLATFKETTAMIARRSVSQNSSRNPSLNRASTDSFGGSCHGPVGGPEVAASRSCPAPQTSSDMSPDISDTRLATPARVTWPPGDSDAPLVCDAVRLEDVSGTFSL